jgi:hypothetical protein
MKPTAQAVGAVENEEAAERRKNSSHARTEAAPPFKAQSLTNYRLRALKRWIS